MNAPHEDRPNYKRGVLTAAGASHLGVPALSGYLVDYEEQYHEQRGAYAGEIFYQGRRLGDTLSLGDDGIVPWGQEAERHVRERVARLLSGLSSTHKPASIKTVRLRLRLDRDSHEYRLALSAGFAPVSQESTRDPGSMPPQERMPKAGKRQSSRRKLLFAHHDTERKEQTAMLHRTSDTSTTDEDRHVITELAPQMKRRASRQVMEEPVPVWKKSTYQPLSRRRIYASLALGVLCAVILLIVGTIVVNWINDGIAHWHGGDSYVSMIDANTGHDATGNSHLLAFYRPGHIVLIECSHDYQNSHSYSVSVSILDDQPHLVHLSMQTTAGHPVLLLSLDNGIAEALYSTSDGWSTTPA